MLDVADKFAGSFYLGGQVVGDGKVQVFFGEGIQPDKAQFLDGLSEMKVWSVGSDATLVETLKVEQDGVGYFECVEPKNDRAIELACLYGVFGRGDQTMLLHYSAKYLDVELGIATHATGNLPLDVELVSSKSGLTVRVLYEGKPVNNCELVSVHSAESESWQTNAEGIASLGQVNSGRMVLRAAHSEKTPGVADEKSFQEKRFYCTVVLDMAVRSDRATVAADEGITTLASANDDDTIKIEESPGWTNEFWRCLA